MKYLVVGLGNIGPEYADTRHNIGFDVLDAFVKASNAVFEDKRYGAVCELKLKGRTVVLLKPNTYMNLSGKAVNYWMKEKKTERENLLVISDDLALPLGTIRMRKQGSEGGHNGLKSITESIGGNDYARLRVGIGDNFSKGSQINYVLGTFRDEERKELPFILERAVKAIEAFITMGPDRAMTICNAKAAQILPDKE